MEDKKGRYRIYSDVDEHERNAPYKELAARVVEKACDDYVSSLLKIMRFGRSDNPRAKNELDFANGKRIQLEHFFKSSYFQLLCGGRLNGQTVISKLRNRVGFTL